MRKKYEKPCVEVIDFALKDYIMNFEIDGNDPTFEESVPDAL